MLTNQPDSSGRFPWFHDLQHPIRRRCIATLSTPKKKTLTHLPEVRRYEAASPPRTMAHVCVWESTHANPPVLHA